MAVKLQAACGTDPGLCQDFVAQNGGVFVINLMAQDHPKPLLLFSQSGGVPPVRHGNILHPAHVGHIVDVLHAINIGRQHLDADLENFPGRLHLITLATRNVLAV